MTKIVIGVDIAKKKFDVASFNDSKYGILHKRPKVVDTFDLKKIDNKRP
jgi:hypothetical protein